MSLATKYFRSRTILALMFGAAVLAAAGVMLIHRDSAPDWPATRKMVREAFPTVRYISTTELAAWLNSVGREPPVLLDVRTAEEYAISHLPGALRIDPGAHPGAIPAGVGKDAAIVLYCSVGYRSSALAQLLQDAGYTRVLNLEGSLFQWANEGRPVVRGDQIVDEVHPYDKKWGKLLESRLHP